MTLSVPSQRTWTVGDIVTAAEMNANVRDSVAYLINPPIFIGVQNSPQTVANNVFSPLGLDTETVDNYNGHSTSTNNSRYTSQVRGYYECNGRCTFGGSATGKRIVALFVNGSAYRNNECDPASANVQSVSISDFVFLDVGDYVETYVFQTSGGVLVNNTGTGYASSMSVQWCHA